VNAKWPAGGAVDEILVKSSQYLMSAAHEFRIRHKGYCQPAGGGKTNKGKAGAAPAARQAPTHATIYVAETYPTWQSAVLTTMRSLMTQDGASPVVNEAEPPATMPDNKLLSTTLAKLDAVSKHMKKVMPFVQAVKDRVLVQGIKALNLTLDFDEKEVLESNLEYLMSTLDVSNFVTD
jgi:leucyl-tRNA synthetase